MMAKPRQPEMTLLPSDAGFDEFFAGQQQRVLKLCWFSTLDAHVAADVAQEAFARAYSNWESISSGQPAAWIRTVALNLCRDKWRQEGRISHTEPPEAGRSDRYEDIDLLQALELLSGRQREVVMLRYWADLKLADCAEAMDVSVSSAKQHLSRAHDRLRDLLGPDLAKELSE